jgi:hypothetical protein
MTEDQKREIHPIVERALEMAYEGFESIEFDDYAVEQLQDMLKEYYGKQDLIRAITELLNLAVLLDKQGSHSASVKMIIVATSATDALEDLNKKNKI